MILILLLIIFGSSLWENAPWNKAKTYKDLNSLYRIYVDPLATLEAEDLIQKPHRKWRQPANKKMNFGFDSATYWLKADFQATESGAFILELPYSLLLTPYSSLLRFLLILMEKKNTTIKPA